MAQPKAAPDLQLDRVRQIVLSALGGQRARVFLFGSRATGGAARASDIDVGILPEEPLTRGTLARLREALEESTVPYAVEVVDLSTVDETFRRRVVESGVPWTD